MRKRHLVRIACSLLLVLSGGMWSMPRSAEAATTAPPGGELWSAGEKRVLTSLSLSALPPLPKDPSNKFADDPQAQALGKRFFFDPQFSSNGEVSCASCHKPETVFTDLLPLAKGMGTSTRRTMPLAGVAYQAWFFWDGRKDSLWSQAIGPIENTVEHGYTRSMCVHLIMDHYRSDYEAVFGALPPLDHQRCPPQATPGTGNPAANRAWMAMRAADREAVNLIYSNIGKAIAAYVRQILPGPAPFDRYVAKVNKGDGSASQGVIPPEAVHGLKLFIGKAACINCHNGPLFSNGFFHRTIVPGVLDQGRAEGITKVMADEFNCLGAFSDAAPGECAELRFIDTDRDKYQSAFKTPTLRNVAERPPYMHAGQAQTLTEVLLLYRHNPTREYAIPDLSDEELDSLEAFLKTLSGPIVAP